MIDGSDIKRRREQLGISLRKLAKMADISPSYLSMIESGQRDAPNKYILERIEASLIQEEGTIEEVEVKKEIYSHYKRSERVETMIEDLAHKLRKYNKRGGMDIEEMTEIMEEIKEIVKA